MKIQDINDERIVAESNKVYKTCFIALCIAIFVDTVFKFTVWYYLDPQPVISKQGFFIGSSSLPFYAVWGLEALTLATIFLVCLFSLAKKGILLGNKNSECERFPFRRYALISSIAATVVFVFLTSISILISLTQGGTAANEYGIWGAVIILFIYALVATPVFVFFYTMFYVAYRVAKTSIKKKGEES